MLSNALRPGLQGLARTRTQEYAARGVTCKLICPGMTLTDRIEQLIRRRMSDEELRGSSSWRRSARQFRPAARPGNPREVGAAAGCLASPEAAFVSGQSLFIDGGQSAV